MALVVQIQVRTLIRQGCHHKHSLRMIAEGFAPRNHSESVPVMAPLPNKCPHLDFKLNLFVDELHYCLLEFQGLMLPLILATYATCFSYFSV